jgi:serine palmitoyltransferase
MFALYRATSRELLERGVASVIVGFPATKLTEGRLRFCISASHTKEMLDKVIKFFILEITNFTIIKILLL